MAFYLSFGVILTEPGGGRSLDVKVRATTPKSAASAIASPGAGRGGSGLQLRPPLSLLRTPLITAQNARIARASAPGRNLSEPAGTLWPQLGSPASPAVRR